MDPMGYEFILQIDAHTGQTSSKSLRYLVSTLPQCMVKLGPRIHSCELRQFGDIKMEKLAQNTNTNCLITST
jgi:hypothetical protein